MSLVVYYASSCLRGESLFNVETMLLEKQMRRSTYPLMRLGDRCIWEIFLPMRMKIDVKEGADTLETAIYWPS